MLVCTFDVPDPRLSFCASTVPVIYKSCTQWARIPSQHGNHGNASVYLTLPHLYLHDSWLFWFRLFTSTKPQHDPSPHLIHLLTDCFLRTMTISQLPCADISAEVTTHPADPRSNLSISRSCCLRHHSRRSFSHEAP